MKKISSKKHKPSSLTKSRLQLLTGSALLLPGLLQPAMSYAAADDDEVDFQYSHYQEGKRTDIYKLLGNQTGDIFSKYKVPNNAAPIEVDSLHGSSRISLTDRIKFGFNYIEDTWAGATPIGSAPEQSNANSVRNLNYDPNGNPIVTGASPLARGGGTAIDSKGNFYYPTNSFDPAGNLIYAQDRIVHVMGYASPETRKQGDFKLGYQWDQAGLDLGGGVSDERDYHSRFVNLGGRMDFNQKLTTVELGLSYTNSDTEAIPNLTGSGYFYVYPNNPTQLSTRATHDAMNTYSIRGNRQDWASHLGLTQVINKDAVLNLGMSYTRSTGFMENPYKASWFTGVDPTAPLQDGYMQGFGHMFAEQRPDQRNQLNWKVGWTQYVQPFDAGLHVNYQFAHDDWGVNAHTFDADWVQPLGAGWTLTPRVRYYSQDAANFYKAFFVVGAHQDAQYGVTYDLPQNWSSDQRLSGYGALSGGVVLSKQFAKGISLETGFEYYSHQGGLKLGGGGEQAFADYDYWVANAALKLNLTTLGQGLRGSDHAEHASHGNVPAGLMFAHTLGKAGDMMAGYRYQHSRQAGDMLHGDRTVGGSQAFSQGCPGAYGGRTSDDLMSLYNGPCPMLPNEMVMNMHMLELMYAPSDRLTLMLMPQFADMSMGMHMPTMDLANMPMDQMEMAAHNRHESGGIGDTGAYALVTLFDQPGQHLHIGLGGTAPTGDVAVKLKEGTNKDGAFMDYGMQLGSGTWDLKPSLTYLGQADDWSWGGQLSGTKRLGDRNASGYRLGDAFESSVWGGYNLTRWLSSTMRLAYSWQDSIQGRFPRSTRFDSNYVGACNQADYTSYANYDDAGVGIGAPILDQAGYSTCLASIEDQKHQRDATDHMSSQDYPRNYGGHYLDLGLGVSATVPSGSLAGNKLSFEWLQPMYTNVNGYQLNRDGALTFTWSYGF